MEQTQENIFINTPFTAESLNVQDYSIIEVSKGQIKKGTLLSGADFVVDASHLLEVMNKKGKVYGYKRKGVLKALYVVTAEKHLYSCDEVYYSAELSGEPVTDLMDQQVVFLIAQRASYYEDGSAIFRGTKVPKLVSKTGSFNWYWAIIFSLLYGVVFVNVLKSAAGAFVGISLGCAMGFCFRPAHYEYVREDNAGQ